MATTRRIIIIKLNGRGRPSQTHQEQVLGASSPPLSLPRHLSPRGEAGLQVGEDEDWPTHAEQPLSPQELTVILEEAHSPEREEEHQTDAGGEEGERERRE